MSADTGEFVFYLAKYLRHGEVFRTAEYEIISRGRRLVKTFVSPVAARTVRSVGGRTPSCSKHLPLEGFGDARHLDILCGVNVLSVNLQLKMEMCLFLTFDKGGVPHGADNVSR